MQESKQTMAAIDPNKFKSSVDGPLTGEPSNDAAELVEKGQRAVKNLSHKLSQGQEDIARAATQLTDSIAKGKDELARRSPTLARRYRRPTRSGPQWPTLLWTCAW